MRVITKKTTALLLSLLMVMMCIPASAFTVYADESDFTVVDGVITEYNGSDTNLTIPSEVNNETITGIGEQAFIAKDIEGIVIPSTITTIDVQAFYYNYYLSIVEFKGAVPSIGSEAFCYTGSDLNFVCNTAYETALKKALVESCECSYDCYDDWTINNKYFSKIEDSTDTGDEPDKPAGDILKYTTRAVEGGVEITEVTGSFSSVNSAAITVTVPSEIDGQTVVGIADPEGYNSGVFDNLFVGLYNSKLKEFTVVLPEGIKYIGNKAFENNKGLVAVNLPSSLERIGDEAFSLCSNLKSASLPEGLKTLGKGAFSKCISLTKAYIPASVSTPMPDSKTDFAFAMCSGITEFIVAEGNKDYASNNGVIYTKDNKTLVSYPLGSTRTSFVIPEGVETVANGAFALIQGDSSSLNEISFPVSLKTIENRAFKSLALESVTVGSGIEWGTYGFDLTKIKNITVAEGVTEIPEGFFNGVTGVESVTLPSTLKKIGNRAFDRFPLSNITLPEGLEEIGEEAFENSSLTSVTIPSTVTKIGDRAFYSCAELEQINIVDGNTELDLGNYTFNWCKNLNNVELPARVKTLGDGVFSMCSALTDINMKGAVKLGNSTFYGCSSLTEINMADTIREIGNATFMFCSKLETVTLPANLAKWGSCTFECCSSLKNITIPDTVAIDSVPEDTFYNCINLEELTLPKSITRTEPCAFSKCEKLTKIIVKNTSGSFKRSEFDCYDFNGEGLDGTWIYNTDGSKSYKYDYDFTKDTDGILSAGGGCCGGTGKGTINSTASAKPQWNYEQAPSGGLDASTPDKTTAITVNDTKTETIKNEAGQEISKITATVSKAVAEKLVDQAVSNKSDTVEIIVKSDGGNKVDSEKQVELEIPKSAVKDIADKTDASLVINTDNGQVVLDNKTLETIASETEGDTVKIAVNENTQLKESQKPAADAIGDNGYIFDLRAYIGDKLLHDFKGGKATVTLPMPEKLDGKEVAVIYINDKGICEILNHTVKTVGADKYIRFTTPHFSTFAVVESADAEKLIKQQNQDKANTLIKEAKLAASTSKTSKKNVKVTIGVKADKSLIKELESMGYTVKYKYYRSTKKASKYTAVKTKTGNTYINTTGKKGTKYYYKAKILVYDGKELIAQTALKQCSYGVRTWSK